MVEIIEYDGHRRKNFHLKIKKAHYLELSKEVGRVINENPGIHSAYKKKGFSEERFRWDLLHLSGFDTRPLYEYLNDVHIDSALKHIVKFL